MKCFVAVTLFVTLAVAENHSSSAKKEKRGVGLFAPPGIYGDFYGGLPQYGVQPWNPAAFQGFTGWNPQPYLSDVALGQIQLQASHNIAVQTLADPAPITPGIAYTPDVIRAIHQAKEANQNVLSAQQRVAEVKEAAVLQQKIALAKEAAAREAAYRSAEISSHASADARTSAKHLVALQQRLATLKDAVAAAQRVAAAREAAAAAAIQRVAANTAAELKKQDVDKQISQSEQEAKVKDLLAAKENAIANALHNTALQKQAYRPWG